MDKTLPQGFTIRSATKEDLEIMDALGCEYQLAYQGEVDFTLDDLRTLCDAPTFDMAEQCRLVFDATGRLVYIAYFNQQAYIRYSISLNTLPGHENAGVRAYLMALGEEWARREMVKAPLEARTFLQAWVPAKDAAAHAWYKERRDFAQVRRFWEMQIEMQEMPPAPIWPEGVSLRPFEAERDAHAVFEADEEFFRDHWGHLPQDYPRWRHWTVEREGFDPTLWFIARSGEQIVGVSLCKDEEKGWVDDLGVARGWRGKGLGLALLQHSFGEFYRRGKYKVGLSVDSENLTGATRLYERAGMHVTQETIVYEKEMRAGIDLSVQVLPV